MRKELLILGAIPALLLLIGAPLHAFALSDQQRYDAGFSDGVNDAMNTWNSGGQYDSSCPTDQHHTDVYCSGYADGYNHWWNSAQNNVNGNVQQSNEQNANVKINGNNNRVNIEQQAGNNNGGSDGHHGGSQNPECRVLCLGVSIK